MNITSFDRCRIALAAVLLGYGVGAMACPVTVLDADSTRGLHDRAMFSPLMQLSSTERRAPAPAQRMAATPCVDGMADIYPCSNVDLLSFMPLSQLGSGSGNDIWGWADPSSGRDFALFARTSGTSFV